MANGNPFLVRPADYSQGFGMLSQGLGALAAKRERDAQQAQQAEVMSGLQAAVDSGDMNQVSAFLMKNPRLSSNIQENVYRGMGIMEQGRKDKFKADLFNILSNPDQAQDIYTARIKEITESGGDPSQTMAALGSHLKNPNNGLQQAEALAASMFPEEHAQWEKVMRSRQVEPMTEYQSAMIDSKKVDQELRRLELEDKKLERQLKRETDTLKRDELQQKIDANKADMQSAQQAKEQAGQDAINFSVELYTLADEIASDPQLDRVTGTISTMLPTVSGQSQDLINKAERLESMLTKENLGLMTGVLTDKDIQMLRSISSGLNVTEGGIKGSYEGTKKRLEQISSKVKSALDSSGMNKTKDNQQKAPQAAIDYLMSNPQFSEQFKQKYGYLPEGM